MEQLRLNHINMLGINDSHVCGWISASLWRGVKEIDLVFGRWPSHFTMLPTALLFTSKTLVRLKLEFPDVMVVPIHVCLPCLKTLVLESVEFEDGGSVERLLSSCPVLEDLSISNFQLFAMLDIVIDLPSLVYFKYHGFRAYNYSFGNMPSLVTADINISVRNSERETIYRRSHGLVELFEGLGNVKSLCLSIYPGALPILSHTRFVAFQKLLHLQIFDRLNTWKGKGLFEFLEFSPNLQTLVTCKVSNEVSFPMEKVPSCVVYQLKEFKVLDFDDESSLFQMVTYILNNATVLDKLTITTSQDLKLEKKFKITQRLSSIPRCSNKCQVMSY
ncbi:hypothetical protein V6N11_004810 [Hibiscus sabdariffa]|uniref:FBD domain-containing protein n=1 Tax=Hibiscus sabdariffa TaxID=183260 RepID=A0ABR2SI72_9ROSI